MRSGTVPRIPRGRAQEPRPNPLSQRRSLALVAWLGKSARKRTSGRGGYYCAVAMLLKLTCREGVSDPDTDQLFRGGGDWRAADPEDIETFRRHGLLPNDPDQRTR